MSGLTNVKTQQQALANAITAANALWRTFLEGAIAVAMVIDLSDRCQLYEG